MFLKECPTPTASDLKKHFFHLTFISSRVYLTQRLWSVTVWGQSSSVGHINLLSSIGAALNPELQALLTAMIAILHDTDLVSGNILSKSVCLFFFFSCTVVVTFTQQNSGNSKRSNEVWRKRPRQVEEKKECQNYQRETRRKRIKEEKVKFKRWSTKPGFLQELW